MQCVLTRPETQPMRSVPEILQDRGIKKIFIVGLVYDFCVSETAIFGMEGLSLWSDFQEGGEAGITHEIIRQQGNYGVTVLTDLTRPSFDGKPGAPYTAGVCDGDSSSSDLMGLTNGAFCVEGGGTIRAFENWQRDMEFAGVNVSRRADVDCTHLHAPI